MRAPGDSLVKYMMRMREEHTRQIGDVWVMKDRLEDSLSIGSFLRLLKALSAKVFVEYEVRGIVQKILHPLEALYDNQGDSMRMSTSNMRGEGNCVNYKGRR